MIVYTLVLLLLTAPQKDGQAELTTVASYTKRCFTHLQMVTHVITDRA